MNLTQENLPPSSISVFLTGFVAEKVQNENNLFKFIKLAVTEFVGGVNTGKKFLGTILANFLDFLVSGGGISLTFTLRININFVSFFFF